MKFYISGKIGKDKPSPETLAKFKEAEDMLSGKGHEVFNPTTSGLGLLAESLARAADYETSFYQEILLLDLVQLSQCDAVYFLKDWRLSPGATAEYHFAKAIGKRMYFEDRQQACEYLIERMYREAKEENMPIEYDTVQDRNDIEIAYFKKHLHEAWQPFEGKEPEP